jgi:hypothetical protein
MLFLAGEVSFHVKVSVLKSLASRFVSTRALRNENIKTPDLYYYFFHLLQRCFLLIFHILWKYALFILGELVILASHLFYIAWAVFQRNYLLY